MHRISGFEVRNGGRISTDAFVIGADWYVANGPRSERGKKKNYETIEQMTRACSLQATANGKNDLSFNRLTHHIMKNERKRPISRKM